MPQARSSRHCERGVRRLSYTIAAGLAAFGLLLLAILAGAGWLANRAAAARERSLLENAIDRQIESAVEEVSETARRGDLEAALQAEGRRRDEIYFFSGEDRASYAIVNGRRDAALFERRGQAFAPLIAQARARGAAGYALSIDARPAIVAAAPIAPNTDEGVATFLIAVDYIDDANVADLARSISLRDLAITRTPTRRGGFVSAPFVAADGALLGYMSWRPHRPGQALFIIVLPFAILALAAFGFWTSRLLRRIAGAASELARREAQWRREARRDALSGLPNRSHFIERLDDFLNRTARPDRFAVAAYIDVDQFKEINDAFGHHAGDRLIQAVAQRLGARLRPEDFLARFGGDEFAILCAPSRPEGGEALARRVARAFASPFTIDGRSIRLTASVGIAAAPDHGATTHDLMRSADLALYEAKKQGRDRAVLFSPDIAAQREERRALESDLRAALESNQLRLHYQPIVSCRTNRIVAVEALLRWNHPERGEISPALFIPIAEECGLMPALGEWVLHRAMADAKRWPDLEVSINLSPVQLRHVDLEALLRRLLDEHGLDAGQFVLEITEGVVLDANGRTKRMLEAIRAMGFKTALDDFGAGYSSLAYLNDFKFDKIKIDRSFVRGGENCKAIAQAVATLGRGLGMRIVAEGVESESEAVLMTHFGCTELQGFYFSRPVDALRMEALLKSYEPRRPARPYVRAVAPEGV